MNRLLRLVSFICVLGLLSGCGSVSLRDLTAGDLLSQLTGQENNLLSTATPVVDTGAPAFLWAREQLSEHAQKAYDIMSEAIACRVEEEVDVESDEQEIELVLTALRMDHPEYFWFDGAATFVSTELAGVPVKTACTFNYSLDPGEIQVMALRLRQYTSACLASPAVAFAQNDYDKIMGVYRYLIEHTDYVLEETDQSICSVILNGRGTCAGYARTFQYLMNQLGIPCTLALGMGANAEAHGWNVVQCQGQWYQMDVTWGDPVNPDGTPGSGIQYTYCMLTDAEIYRDHTLDSAIPLPVCTDTTWNYYIQTGRQYDVWDEAIYEAALSTAKARGEDWFRVRFSGPESYEAAMDSLFTRSGIVDILTRQGLLEEYGAQQVVYTTSDLFYEISVRLN